MDENDALRHTLQTARTITHACVIEARRRAFAGREYLDESDTPEVVERSILVILLSGLIDQAKTQGIPWESVVQEAEVFQKAVAALPLTDLVQ